MSKTRSTLIKTSPKKATSISRTRNRTKVEPIDEETDRTRGAINEEESVKLIKRAKNIEKVEPVKQEMTKKITRTKKIENIDEEKPKSIRGRKKKSVEEPVNQIVTNVDELSIQRENVDNNEYVDDNVDDVLENSEWAKQEYKKLDLRGHIYQIPDTYIGGDIKAERQERLFDLKMNKFVEEEISLPVGVERLFVEVVSNAGDNAYRSASQNINPGTIKITMDDEWISVRNGGIPILIEMHPTENVYNPELIFGNLLTSSAYVEDKYRTTSSRNGLGIKLVNIFSKNFMIEIGDSVNKKLYKQAWHNNMLEREEAIIKPYTGKSYVEVKYKLDFIRFGYEKYPEEAFKLYARHAADISFTCKVPVLFNENKLHVQDIKDYAKLYFGHDLPNHFVYYRWEEGVETVKKGRIEKSVNKLAIPEIELIVLDGCDNALTVAFVNGMWTKGGGEHLSSCYTSVSKSLLALVNDSQNKKGGKSTKNQIKLTIGDVRRHLSIITSFRIRGPKFDSQSKNVLVGPKASEFKLKIPEDLLNNVKKWDIVDRLHQEVVVRQERLASKTDGRKGGRIKLLRGVNANLAGTSESHKCVMCCVEGNSAFEYVSSLRAALGEYGHNYYGCIPIKGKSLNVRNCGFEKIYDNAEILELKKALGIKEKVDYMIDQNFRELNYGSLMIVSDQDPDGIHITGLIINIIDFLYPSLLKRGYVKSLRTPLIRAFKGTKPLSFYTQNQYDQWYSTSPKGYEIVYCKGLASSTEKDVKEDVKDMKIVQYIYDELAPTKIDLVFNKKFADNRKEWIMKYWIPDYEVGELLNEKISEFIDHEFSKFSVVNVKRSIPSLLDGFKISQRKIIWGAMNWWGKKDKSLEKLDSLACHISSYTHYHHGPKSLEGALVNMAQDYVGANNMPLFVPHGMFGSRLNSGISGASRYLKTKPDWMWPYIFIDDDKFLYEQIEEEGYKDEPKTFFPIVPLQLINSAKGIATGWSTETPMCHPLDIINWLLCRIYNKPLPTIIPWFKGFKGTVKMIQRKTVNSITSPVPLATSPKPIDNNDDTEPIDDENRDPMGEDHVGLGKNSYATIGTFEVNGIKRNKYTVTVNELPIGRYSNGYKDWLEKMIDDKKISRYESFCEPNSVKFVIHGMSEEPTIKNLRLERTFGLSNMVMLDDNYKPIKLDSIQQMLEVWFNIRIVYYQTRKDFKLKDIRTQIAKHQRRIEFISACLNGDIKYAKVSKDELYRQMDKFGFEHELAKDVKIYNLTLEQIKKAETQIATLIKQADILEKTSPGQLWAIDLNAFADEYKKRDAIEQKTNKKTTTRKRKTNKD